MYLPQQLQRVNPDPAGDAFDGLQGQVAFTALDAAHVGAVDVYLVGEGFLAETKGLTVTPEVVSEPPLKFPFHGHDARATLR